MAGCQEHPLQPSPALRPRHISVSAPMPLSHHDSDAASTDAPRAAHVLHGSASTAKRLGVHRPQHSEKCGSPDASPSHMFSTPILDPSNRLPLSAERRTVRANAV